MKLNVGCGSTWLEGFTNIDLYRADAPVHDDARTLATFADDSADEILASHVLEHLGRYEAPAAVAAWKRVLKPGGILRVIVPDVPKQIKLWLRFYEADDPRVWEFRSFTIWGNQVHPGEYHKWGYDIHTLRQLLADAGFVSIALEYGPGLDTDLGDQETACIHAEARKP